MKSRRLAISRVRQAWLGVAAAAVVAVPVGLATLSGPDEPAQAGLRSRSPSTSPSGGPRSAVDLAPPSRTAGTPRVAAPSAEIAANRSVLARIRALDDRALRQLAVSGDDLERAAAVHVLWLRGAREDVEALVASSNDRLLAAKLSALRGRGE